MARVLVGRTRGQAVIEALLPPLLHLIGFPKVNCSCYIFIHTYVEIYTYNIVTGGDLREGPLTRTGFLAQVRLKDTMTPGRFAGFEDDRWRSTGDGTHAEPTPSFSERARFLKNRITPGSGNRPHATRLLLSSSALCRYVCTSAPTFSERASFFLSKTKKTPLIDQIRKHATFATSATRLSSKPLAAQ